jgi:hypothetical protein
MNIYKVEFKNNLPERATMVRNSYYKELTKIEKIGKRTFLKWLYLHAENESKAIENAITFKKAILDYVKS